MADIIKPTPRQVEWADCEIGVIIHMDLQTFKPYDFRDEWGNIPDPNIFNPIDLNTDQWIKIAKDAGAKYAVLVAKHCSGFSLWPTKAHDYSVANIKWRDGKGDIVQDFINSCKKYGIKPGIYCSASVNAYFLVDNPGIATGGSKKRQKMYNEVVIKQLTELWSNYGDLFEIWFDGGVLPVEQGGPDVASLMKKLQPEAVVFQGPEDTKSLIRWVGNEDGEAPLNCFSTYSNKENLCDGTIEKNMSGDPFDPIWMPAESDMPNRDRTKSVSGGWFWADGQDDSVFSAEYLTDRYFKTVGRNTNLLLGMVIDNRGLIPDKDAEEFVKFGKKITSIFSSPIASTKGHGENLFLDLNGEKTINYIVICEDITQGERVLDYKIEGFDGENWVLLAENKCIGHKRIEIVEPIGLHKLRLVCNKFKEVPIIKEFTAY